MSHQSPIRWISIASFCSILLTALSACNDSAGGGGLSNRAVDAPASIAVGEALHWDVALIAGEQSRSTVFDAGNNVVFLRDYDANGRFEWTPFQPGTYLIHVDIKNTHGSIALGQALVEGRPRGEPIVTGTSHPLVALYTFEIPEGREGNVSYTCESCPDTIAARTFNTPLQAGTGTETGVLLPGLRPDSTYTIQHIIHNGALIDEYGPELTYSTGSIPISIPTVEVIVPPINPGVNALLAVSVINGISLIVDEAATPVWYMPTGDDIFRPTGDGWTAISSTHEMKIVDYTGQARRSINLNALNSQLTARGFPNTLVVHHEVRPLPQHRFAVFGLYERLLTNQQGPGAVDVVGDTVIVVDDQMRVVWTWDSFDHLDVTRPAILGDVIPDGFLGIHLQLASQANDWTHMNSIDYDPKDGNLLLSIRHQAWVVKVAYENGAGDGHIIWRLGEGGDYTIKSDDPSPWFSYQHDANVLPDGRIAVYDNGNVRVGKDGGNSRGQVYILDEKSRTATLEINIDLGMYSSFLGSAALTPDGSLHFNSGVQAIHDTVTSDGFLNSSYHTEGFLAYRSYQMSDPFDMSPN
jgi:hypothetical protein